MAMPVVFIGHGSPMNSVEDNGFTRQWAKMGESYGDVRAVVCISAHWYTQGTGVTAMSTPRTIHDFGGFPNKLYRIKYPAPGDPSLAKEVQDLLSPTEVVADLAWGLDHGTWSVLIHMFPKADVPVVQLSIDATAKADVLLDMGKRLAELRERGILIVGSGNIVHNLAVSIPNLFSGNEDVGPYPWCSRFDQTVRDLVGSRDFPRLVNYTSLGDDAQMAAPTPDHYLPLLYVLGASQESDQVSFPVDGFVAGGISMTAVQMG